MATIDSLYYTVNGAIDYAFEREKYTFNFFEYLKNENFKKNDIEVFLKSPLGVAINHQIEEIELYLSGGEEANLVRESYSWMGKARARRVKEYLEKIMEDAKNYERSKRRGRKPSTTPKKTARSTNT